MFNNFVAQASQPSEFFTPGLYEGTLAEFKYEQSKNGYHLGKVKFKLTDGRVLSHTMLDFFEKPENKVKAFTTIGTIIYHCFSEADYEAINAKLQAQVANLTSMKALFDAIQAVIKDFSSELVYIKVCGSVYNNKRREDLVMYKQSDGSFNQDFISKVPMKFSSKQEAANLEYNNFTPASQDIPNLGTPSGAQDLPFSV
jgi:hypothetical protein